jgi:YbbR domain-containing protein
MSAVNSILNLLRFNRKNWKAVVLCLVAATVFWFFNALNKTYTTQLSFPIEIQYDRDNFVPVSGLPTEVKMNVTGIGWTLIRRTAGVKVPALMLPLERPTEVKKVVGSTLPALLGNQVNDLQINFVATDTLRIDIEPIVGRWLALTTEDLFAHFKSGYGLASNITLTPDSVFVEGPRRLVQALPNPYPLKLPAENIDEDTEAELRVSFQYSQFRVEPTQTIASFRVEPMKELTDSVALEIVQLPAQFKRKPSIKLKQVHYTLQLAESSWRTLYNRTSIKASLSLHNLQPGKTRVAPTLTGLPPFSKVVRIDSVEVSF